jgi:hypothetical protein
MHLSIMMRLHHLRCHETSASGTSIRESAELVRLLSFTQFRAADRRLAPPLEWIARPFRRAAADRVFLDLSVHFSRPTVDNSR